MANAHLRIEIFEPPAAFALPRGDLLGMPIYSGQIATKMAEYSGSPAAMTVPSEAGEIFTVPPSPIGASYLLVRLSSLSTDILATFGRGADPALPQMPTASGGADPTPGIRVSFPVLMTLRPGDKIRARAIYG